MRAFLRRSNKQDKKNDNKEEVHYDKVFRVIRYRVLIEETKDNV